MCGDNHGVVECFVFVIETGRFTYGCDKILKSQINLMRQSGKQSCIIHI